VPADECLQQVVDENILSHGNRSFIVEKDHRAIGLLTLHRVKETPRNEWATTSAGQAMVPMKDVKRTRPDSEMWDALEEMDRDGVNQLPVMIDGECTGMIRREDLLGFLRTHRELDQ
jgi:predicted transcriptional regulator